MELNSIFRILKFLGAINLAVNDGILMFSTDSPIIQTIMAAQQTDTINPGDYKPLLMKSMYKFGKLGFVPGDFDPKAKVTLASNDLKMKSESTLGLKFKIIKNDESREVFISGNQGVEGESNIVDFGDIQMNVSYGAKRVELPFSLQLRDFEIERYPGTENPSSYASEVTVLDPAKSVNKEFRIYMNNILNYGGYRFFQSSFDKDELGTYLSVNRDFWGTLVSYTGYFLLTLGMIMTFFARNSRFSLLLKKMNRNNSGTLKTLLMIISVVGLTSAGLSAADPVSHFSKSQASELGKIVVQDFNGRFKPMNTLSNEVLRKISKKENLYSLTSDQILWSMMKNPMEWQNVPVINIGKMPEIQKIVGTTEKLASFSQFFTSDGDYKLMENVRQSQSVMPKDQNMLDKAILKLDEKVNITSMMLSQQFLRVFPVPDHPGDAWVSPADIRSMKTTDPKLLEMYDGF